MPIQQTCQLTHSGWVLVLENKLKAYSGRWKLLRCGNEMPPLSSPGKSG